MQPSRVVLFAGAAGFALCSALLVRAWVDSVREASAAPAPVIAAPAPKVAMKVLVSANNLPSGHVLRGEDLRWQSWPDGDVMSDAVVEGRGDREQFLGGVLRQGVPAGVPVTPQLVVFPGERGVLAAMLRPGYRAVTVSITGSVGLSGLVVPGDRVDVIVSLTVHRPGEQGERRLTQTILRDVRVIAVDQSVADRKLESGSGDTTAHNATLEVTAKQAETLVLVGDMGKVSLSLRGMGDEQGGDNEQSITWDSDTSMALGRAEPRVAAPAAPQDKIGIVRGTTPSEVDFARGGQ